MFRIISCLLISVLMTSGFTAPAWAKSTNNKYASIVMDADTGMILSQRYADKPLHPASLTKMMTLLLTFEALDETGALVLSGGRRISAGEVVFGAAVSGA